jgi:uncharacterized repeat protein (TIGR02543 family)
MRPIRKQTIRIAVLTVLIGLFVVVPLTILYAKVCEATEFNPESKSGPIARVLDWFSPVAFACGSHSGGPSAPATYRVTVTVSGNGAVSSSVGGSCSTTCSFYPARDSYVEFYQTPTPGNAFAGWSGACGGSGYCGFTASGNTTLGASFLPLYSLTVSKSGSGTVTSVPPGIDCGATCTTQFIAGTSVALTANPAGGYAFTGWTGACNGTGSCNVFMDGNKSVSAAFSPQLAVTILGAGTVTSNPAGVSCPGTCTAAFPQGSTVTLSGTAGAGFTFGNWSGACSGSGDCTVTMNAPQSVTVTFNPPLTVSLVGSGSVTSNPAGIACPGTCSSVMPYAASVTLTASPDPGWVVDRWTGDCVDFGTTTCTLTMDAAKSVTVYLLPLHTLTVTVGGSGTVVSLPDGIACPPTCSAQFVEGSAVGLVAQPQYGYAAAWSDAACTDPGSCLLTLDADVSASATFSPLPTHTVSVSVGPGGSVTSDPVGIDCGVSCAAPFPEGQGVDLTPQPADGYAFSGWSGACSGSADCSITANADASVSAAFTPLYTVAIGTEGSGNGTVTDSVGQLTGCTTGCVGDYAAGTFVSFHAAPALDSTFDGWNGGGCSGTADCALTVGADGSLAPRFRRTKALLTVSSNSTSQTVTSSTGGIACPGDCTELLPLGTLVTLYATSGDGTQGQVFSGWSDPNSANPCIGIQGSTACTFVLQQDATISAGYRFCSRECGIGFPPRWTSYSTVPALWTAPTAPPRLPVQPIAPNPSRFGRATW